MKAIIAFVNVLVISVLGVVSGQVIRGVKNLYKDLLSDYQKETLPSLGQKDPLLLYMNIWPFTIHDFDETAEVLSMIFGMNMNWRDPQLTWNPYIYDNVTSFSITTNDIWVPYVYQVTSADSFKPLGDESKFYATVAADGSVYWFVSGLHKTKCPTDNSRFPFDTQTCTLTFTLFGSSIDQIYMYTDSEIPTSTFFYPSSDWTIVSERQYIITFSQYSRNFYYVISMKRQPLYYAVTVILPTLLFSLMNPLVFLLPVESGERISLGMTILLSYAIFLTLVASSVPATSNPLCVLLLIMVLIMMISGIIVVCSIVSLYFYHKEDDVEINMCLKQFVMCCSRKKKPRNMYEQEHEIRITGKDVSRFLDKLFGIVSYIILIGILLAYFIFVFVF